MEWHERSSGLIIPSASPPPPTYADSTPDGHRTIVPLCWDDDWGWGWLYDWMVSWLYAFDEDDPVPHPLEYWEELSDDRRQALIDARPIMLAASVDPERRSNYGALHIHLDDSNWDHDAEEEWAYAGAEYNPETWDTDAQLASVRAWNGFDERERLLFVAWWEDFEGFPGVQTSATEG